MQGLTGRTESAADFRESLQYSVATGPFAGFKLMQNLSFTSCFCGSSPMTVTGDGLTATKQNDTLAGDFTVEKSFGKLTIGFTGYGNIDTDNRARLTDLNPRETSVALGGLVGYDFGRFNMTGIVTRSVTKDATVPAIATAPVTRGWLRVVVPVYIAPSALVVARY